MTVQNKAGKSVLPDVDAVWRYKGNQMGAFRTLQTSLSGKHLLQAYFNSDKVKEPSSMVASVVARKWVPGLRNMLLVSDWLVGYRPFSGRPGRHCSSHIGARPAYSDQNRTIVHIQIFLLRRENRSCRGRRYIYCGCRHKDHTGSGRSRSNRFAGGVVPG